MKHQDLVARLRTVGGVTTIKPPAIDLEAADVIEQLEKELAAARKGPFNVNLNAPVVATLTDIGAEIWTKDDAEWKNRLAGRTKVDVELRPMKEGDVLKTSLWSLMRLFGPHIHLGCRVPFENNNIQITETYA